MKNYEIGEQTQMISFLQKLRYGTESKLEMVMNKLKENFSDDEIATLLEDRLVDILEGKKLGLL